MKTLLKFSADYCTPCKQLSKTLAEVNLQGISYQEITLKATLTWLNNGVSEVSLL